MLSLAEALAALPTTADDIAAHLHAKGIRGARQEDGCCPVANYLTGAGFHHVSVDYDQVYAYEALDDVEPPAHVAAFIRRFDDGEWPELVLDDTAEATDA